MAAPRVTFVIMAGGKGERLWPLVRRRVPKVCLAPDSRRSLLQATIDRLAAAWPGAGWLIVTTKDQAAPVRAALLPRLRRRVIVEPQIKNTAACVALAVALAGARRPQQVLVAVPADHWVGDPVAFRTAVRQAIRAAASTKALVTVGLRPTHAHPGLGYIVGGRQTCAGTYRVARFVEKPGRASVARLLRKPHVWWNSGMFIGTAEAFAREFRRWLPQHARHLLPLGQGRLTAQRLARAYAAVAPISFDYGVMDHLREGYVVDGRFAWADLGSWDAWAHLARGRSRQLLVDSQRVTVVSQQPHLVAALGVQDLVIVHTPTATLVCRTDRVQDVRDLARRVDAHAALAAYR